VTVSFACFCLHIEIYYWTKCAFSGFVCEGNFKDSPVRFGMNVLNCQEPPGMTQAITLESQSPNLETFKKPMDRFRPPGWESIPGLLKRFIQIYGLRLTISCKKQGFPEPYIIYGSGSSIFKKRSGSGSQDSNAPFYRCKMRYSLLILSHFWVL